MLLPMLAQATPRASPAPSLLIVIMIAPFLAAKGRLPHIGP